MPKGYTLVICGAHGCTRMTAHKDPKYQGPCHTCLKNWKKRGSYSRALARAAKKVDVDNVEALEYERAEKWSF